MFCCCDPIVFPCPPHIQCNTCLLHCKCILTHLLSDLLIRAFTLARFDERQYKYTVVHGTTALFKSLSSAAPFSSSPCVTSHVSRFSRVTLVAGQHKKRKEKKEEKQTSRLSAPTSYPRGDDPRRAADLTSPALEANTKTPLRPPLGRWFVERVGRQGREIRVEFESIGGCAETGAGMCLCKHHVVCVRDIDILDQRRRRKRTRKERMDPYTL